MKFLALCAVHNRRDKTIRAVEAVHAGMPSNCSLQMCVVDDGSTDGTASALGERFQEVQVLRGDGSLYWGGAMRKGWDDWCKLQGDFDYLLVFNDDIELDLEAFREFVLSQTVRSRQYRESAVAFVGAFRQPNSVRVSYGGLRLSNRWNPLSFEKVQPTGALEQCDSLNMNLAFISRPALVLTDFLDPIFIHRKGDLDFGLRLQAEGGAVYQSATFIGACPRNVQASTGSRRGLLARLRHARSPKVDPPGTLRHYLERHGGWHWPVLWLAKYIKSAVLPA
ncbi:glycosyltransferase [bacterium]|nr:glycosyltransferase [bacterium]